MNTPNLGPEGIPTPPPNPHDAPHRVAPPVYDLTVFATALADVVTSAGGWLFDRVRAGWRVSAVITDLRADRALRILGIHSVGIDTYFETQQTDDCGAALAISTTALKDARVLGHARSALTQHAELTLWGTTATAALERRLGPVTYRLSKTARVYKARAIAALPHTVEQQSQLETFRSCGLWYPPDSSDLVPVA
ncbi:hypothetical protein [Mycobacterium intracellulare]|uniref:hypothetical protein n=1 Tax=Mycobacterium intracellulare TaxID=1767 RepID=UPI001155DDE2|nr:hypothetical protein [Mycobacterium intracellulare]MCA2235512.1 hypothetical protein [Mycobacterium intracellulare]MCA2256638.1 hypothetical protein [Mycobacterium intracellulare]MCA2356823.1 hypothetical protein [Mycobacterium intracellulare]MCA2367741.1 hypothetical protein [Mycobacterium intracellulare]MDM3899102.1 hypothetical protein [Mycobacterium intracellulare]